MRRGTLRLVAALVLAVALAGPVAPARAAGGDSRGGSLWSWAGLWSWLTVAVSHQPVLQTDCGIHIDPDGRCRTAVAPSSDCGSHMDPDGRCATVASPQSGIPIDPNG
jgi:hypothetical protein